MLSIEDNYDISIFNSVLGNFVYLLLPLNSIALKMGKVNKPFLNLIIINSLLSIFFSILCYLLINYFGFWKTMKLSSLNDIKLIFWKIFTNSLISLLNGYLLGNGDYKTLINYNFLSLVMYFMSVNYVTYSLSAYNKILFISLGDTFSILYILYNYRNKLNISFPNNEFTKLGPLMILKNIISIGSLNINNNLVFNFSKQENKNYQQINSNISSFIILFNPISIAIQKKILPKKLLIQNCIIYYILTSFIFNSYLYVNNSNSIYLNIYYLFYYLIMVYENFNIAENKIIKSMSCNFLVVIIKLFLIRVINIKNTYLYYNYLSFSLFIRFLLNTLRLN